MGRRHPRMDLAEPNRLRVLRCVYDPFLAGFLGIYIRRHLRMGWIEGLRLVGLLIPALIVSTPSARSVLHPVDVHGSTETPSMFFVANPVAASARLFSASLLHGCIGLHLWLRVKTHYRKVAAAARGGGVPADNGSAGGIPGARQVAERRRSIGLAGALRQTGRGWIRPSPGPQRDRTGFDRFRQRACPVLIARTARALLAPRRRVPLHLSRWPRGAHPQGAQRP